MTSAQTWALVSAVGAGTATLLNLFAWAFLRGMPDHVPVNINTRVIANTRLWTSAVAFYYVGAWLAIVFPDTLVWFVRGNDRQAWSEFLTPVSAMTFFTIWSVDAVRHLITAVTVRRAHPPKGS